MATYQIKYGDTLSQIAKDNGTTVAELAQLNGIQNPNVIRAGQTINLPDKAPAASAQQSTAQPQSQAQSPIKGVTQEVYDQMSQAYTPDQKVNDAWATIEQLQQKLNGGSKYEEQLDTLVQDLINRPAFKYNVEEDALFQQMLASSKQAGEKAMEDAIARSSALTGGYASSWAQTAGQQTYDQYLQDAYNQLPQYYQLALTAHQMEGEELMRKYSLLSEEDQKAFDRIMSEIGLATDAYDRLYAQDRTKYEDSVALAQQLAGMMSSDYWNNLQQEFAKEQFEYQKEQDRIANQLAASRAYNSSNKSSDDEEDDLMNGYLAGINAAKERMKTDQELAKYLQGAIGGLDEISQKMLLDQAGLGMEAMYSKEDAFAEIDALAASEMSYQRRASEKAAILERYKNTSFYNDLVQRFRYYRF